MYFIFSEVDQLRGGTFLMIQGISLTASRTFGTGKTDLDNRKIFLVGNIVMLSVFNPFDSYVGTCITTV